MPSITRPLNPVLDWSDIVARYDSFKDRPWAIAMADLARRLCDEGFAVAGLVGTMSMHELFLGRSTDILNNPHLRLRPSREFAVLIYEDGSDPPWTLQVGYDELFDRVKRVLVKRARWFRERS